ncbi:uncharacterized protein LOC115753017 [Rhodamnia argentea]|uniref:Uncharacterized protein LOC115753017 n=1 Tax=Rhodamnia argentea TaxID=178133 RepID=A0A8B8QJH7_9MYRT|nr:uncharacterized protein LOC115753017 [Rhodamnia argentea]
MGGLFNWIGDSMEEKCSGMTNQDPRRAKSKIEAEITKIEALLAITTAISVFLGVSGSFRRRCGNGAFAMVAFGAYTLAPALSAYTLGLIQTAPFCRLRLPVWATYLMVVLGNVDSYTAHRMEDIERWKSFKVHSTATYIMISWMIASYAFIWGDPMVCILFVVLFLKVDERARALMLASNSVMQKNFRFVADYMSTEHDSNHGDPATMRGYRYLVRVPEEATTAKCRRRAALWQDGVAPQYRQLLEVTDEVITVDQVWNCEGWLLSVSGGDRDGRLKDLCLSFSLFKFICLIFTGYSLPQQAHDKLRHLIQHMLSEENGHKRVFRIIEVELAFLFDLFYTKYPVNLRRRCTLYRLLLHPIVVVFPASILLTAIWGKVVVTNLATLLLLMSILVVELTQFGIMIFSEWANVTYICRYVCNERWRRNICVGKLIKIMCRVRLVKPWGRQLRQYSFLKSYSYSPRMCIYNRLTAGYLDQKRNGQEQIAPTNLSEQVKKAIVQSLRREHTGCLEKGRTSLRLNGWFDDLSWACNLETTTHVIMVWHIATTFCEHKKPPAGAQLSQGQMDNFGVATKLSQYLAYLVVFAPRLLPDHPCRTEYIFDCAVSEGRRLLGGSSVSMEKRIQELETVSNKNEQSIVGRGARLGMELVSRVANEEQIWKVLADFWADMMLYVAPSDDTAAHAKYLTTGGEFVSHVWVLVSHAGVTRDLRGGEQHDDPERN